MEFKKLQKTGNFIFGICTMYYDHHEDTIHIQTFVKKYQPLKRKQHDSVSLFGMILPRDQLSITRVLFNWDEQFSSPYLITADNIMVSSSKSFIIGY